MNRQRHAALAILVAGSALLYLQVSHRRQASHSALFRNAAGSIQSDSEPRSAQHPSRTIGSNQPVAAEEAVAPDAIASVNRINPPVPSPAAAVPDTAESTSLEPQTILQNMRITIHQYNAAFGENPVGTNPEITAVLQGDNPKHVNFLKPDGNRVNANGELVDPWGTPYFFHQLSAHEMEIRSAGRDRVMYTADDLVIK